MSQFLLTNISPSKKVSSDSSTPFKPPKNAPHTTQKTYNNPKIIVPSNVVTKLEYKFFEDLKELRKKSLYLSL
jgi:hypothetical protein